MIEVVEGRGRCFLADRNYTAGECVLDEECYSFVVAEVYKEVGCCYCAKLCVNENVLALPNDESRYCSEICLRADYPVHKAEMECLKELKLLNIADDASIDPLKLVIKIACKRSIEAPTTPGSGATSTPTCPLNGNHNTFSHIKTLETTSTLSSSSMDIIVKFAELLSKIFVKQNIAMTAEEVKNLLLQIQCNAHRLKLISRNKHDVISNTQSIALGLFPLTSMLNHDCNPNCYHYFVIAPNKVPRLVMRAMRDIQQGEEFVYNYVPLYESTSERQSKLVNAYGFTCVCTRCTSSQQDQLVTARIADEDTSVMEKQLSTCLSLFFNSITSKNVKNIPNIYSKLLKFMETGSKSLHPCHKLMLQYYLAVGRMSLYLVETSPHTSSSESLAILFQGLGYSLLALGCFHHVLAGTYQIEIGEVHVLTARLLHKLCDAASGAACALPPPEVTKLKDILAYLIHENNALAAFSHYSDDRDTVDMLLAAATQHCEYYFTSIAKEPQDTAKLPQFLSVSFLLTGINIVKTCIGDANISDFLTSQPDSLIARLVAATAAPSR